MARALSTLLLARKNHEVLEFGKPVNAVLLEHREDYVGVLEYCDGIYEGLKKEWIDEGVKLRCCEKPFVFFYLNSVLAAYREEIKRLTEGRARTKEIGVLPPDPAMQPEIGLDLESIKATFPSEEVKEAALREPEH